MNSCLIPVGQMDGSVIQTIENSKNDYQLETVCKAFVKNGGAQCGICTPGMIMASAYLLKQCDSPTEQQVREGLAGNLCRCTGYEKIITSVLDAANTMERQPCADTPHITT